MEKIVCVPWPCYDRIHANRVIVCFGGVQSNQGMPIQVFGDVFLKALFVVFDRRGPSLGLAAPS